MVEYLNLNTIASRPQQPELDQIQPGRVAGPQENSVRVDPRKSDPASTSERYTDVPGAEEKPDTDAIIKSNDPIVIISSPLSII